MADLIIELSADDLAAAVTEYVAKHHGLSGHVEVTLTGSPAYDHFDRPTGGYTFGARARQKKAPAREVSNG